MEMTAPTSRDSLDRAERRSCFRGHAKNKLWSTKSIGEGTEGRLSQFSAGLQIQQPSSSLEYPEMFFRIPRPGDECSRLLSCASTDCKCNVCARGTSRPSNNCSVVALPYRCIALFPRTPHAHSTAPLERKARPPSETTHFDFFGRAFASFCL